MTPEDLNTLFLEANEDYNQKRYSSAREKYETVLSFVPGNVVVRHNYGMALIALEQFQCAIDNLSLPIESGYTDSYLSRGSAYRSLGKYQEAINDFASCFIVDPSNAKAYSNYGNSLREFGLPLLAIPFLHKALEVDNTDPTFRLNESVAYLLNGD